MKKLLEPIPFLIVLWLVYTSVVLISLYLNSTPLVKHVLLIFGGFALPPALTTFYLVFHDRRLHQDEEALHHLSSSRELSWNTGQGLRI